MKRLTLIISALALVLGMSQCSKKPNMPKFDNGELQTITFTTGNGGEKVTINNNVLKELHFIWDKTDVLHVYHSTDGTFGEGHSRYIGKLTLPEDFEPSENATFTGLVRIPSSGWIRFCYFGVGVTETVELEETVITVDNLDLTEQYGELKGTENSLEKKIVAWMDKQVSGNSYSGELKVPYTIAKFDLSTFTTTNGNNIVIKGITKVGLSFDKYGKCTEIAGNEVVVKGVKSTNESCFVALVPDGESQNVNLEFSGNYKIGNKEANIVRSKFATKSDEHDGTTGESIVISGEAKYSVADNLRVKFAPGNLQFENEVWKFADHQWDFIGASQTGNYSDRTKPKDLFGWGCTDNIDSRKGEIWCQTYYGPQVKCYYDLAPIAGNINYYGYGPDYYEETKYNLEVTQKSDWGYDMGGESSIWRTPRSSEWQYVIEGRNNNAKFKSTGNKYLAGVGTLTTSSKGTVRGVFILPDNYYENSNNHTKNFTSKLAWTFSENDLDECNIVFLPAAGRRDGDDYYFNTHDHGYYWSSSCGYDEDDHSKQAMSLYFYENSSTEKLNPSHLAYRYHAFAVRLVSNVD